MPGTWEYLDNGYAISHAFGEHAHPIEYGVHFYYNRDPLTLWEKIKAAWYGFDKYTSERWATYAELPLPFPVKAKRATTIDGYAVFEDLTAREAVHVESWVRSLPNQTVFITNEHREEYIHKITNKEVKD